jgi:hypothetical protein
MLPLPRRSIDIRRINGEDKSCNDPKFEGTETDRSKRSV